MSVFSGAERDYLVGGRQLARIATMGADGTPRVVPVAFIYNAARDTIDVGGYEAPRSRRSSATWPARGRAAIVIDDLAGTDPWTPRGIEIRARRSDRLVDAPDPYPPRAHRELGPKPEAACLDAILAQRRRPLPPRRCELEPAQIRETLLSHLHVLDCHELVRRDHARRPVAPADGMFMCPSLNSQAR